MRTRFALAAILLAAGCSFSDEQVEEPTALDRCALGGPWSMSTQADWVRRVVEASGYEVIGETGSAVVVAGKGYEFTISATESPHRSRAMPNLRLLARVRGIPIYGDRRVWRSWYAQGFTFWVHGQGLTPAAGRLAPVVDASLRIPFRDPCEG